MYIVVEIQKNESGQIGNLVTAHETLNEAYQKYHLVLSAASVSTLPCHSAVLLRDDGYTIARGSFFHGETEDFIEYNTEES